MAKPSKMFWALLAVAVVAIVLIIVGGLMLARLLEVRKMESAMRAAWNSVGVCSNDNCQLAVNDSLQQFPTEILSEYNPVTSRRLMDHVARVALPSIMNKTTPSDIMSPPDERLIGYITPDKGPHLGAIWLTQDPHVMVVAFRGTVTAEEIERDLDTLQITFRDTLVHRGFHDVFQRHYEDILQHIRTHQISSVFIGGHSLGGALTQLLALALAEDLPEVHITGYVFGSPRVGNHKFVERIDELTNLISLWREVNMGDVLQELPPMVMPNIRNPLGSLMLYDHAGQANTFKTQWGTWKLNHSLACYIDHVEHTLAQIRLTQTQDRNRKPSRKTNDNTHNQGMDSELEA